MSELRYDIYFRGESLSDKSSEQLKQDFARLFKIDSTKAEHYFSGQNLALRKNLDRATAIKFRNSLAAIGAKVYVQQIQDQAASTAVAEKPAASAEVAVANNENTGLRLLPFGSDVLKEEERSKQQTVEIDLSHIQLSNNTLLIEQQVSAPPPAPDVSHITTAELGADVLEGYYSDSIPLPEPDTSHLTLAQAGSAFDQQAATESVAPDTSHIQLAD